MSGKKAARDGGIKAAVKRVIAERDEVQARLSALCVFVGNGGFQPSAGFLELSPANRILLVRQREVMKEYRDILDVRIELMTGEIPEGAK